MPQMSLEWLELSFECFESRSNGWNWHSNASNHVGKVGITIRILLELLELAFECLKCRWNGWNCLSSASNPVLMVGIGIRML